MLTLELIWKYVTYNFRSKESVRDLVILAV